MSGAGALRSGSAQLGIELSDLQVRQLLAYAALILKWNKVYNLTAVRDASGILTHHLLDSLSVIAPLRQPWTDGAAVLDVGAGAGLPGVVMAILRPDMTVTCVDAVAKKAAFIRQVGAELALPNLLALHARVESLIGSYGMVCSRAFSSLFDFFHCTEHLLAPRGVWLAMKGKVPIEEIAAAKPAAEVFHVEQVNVPGLDADRCLVWARKHAT